MTELFRSGRIFLFWFLTFCFLLIVTFVCLVVAIYIVREAEKEWSKAVLKGRRRKNAQSQNE